MANRGHREKENEVGDLPALWQATAEIGNRLDEHFKQTNRDIQEIQRSITQMNVNLRGVRPQNLHEQQPQLRGVERRGGRRGGRQYAGRRHGPMIEEENSSNSENDDNSSTESDEFAKEAILRANQYERERPQQRTGENRHRSNECPLRKQVDLVEEVGSPTDINSNDELDPNEIEENKMYYERKVCDVIVDNGSIETIIARSLVRNLKLPVEKHPQPYKIGWIKNEGEHKVLDVCEIHFSIEKSYKDSVRCDVVDMDACHLLLGRPW
ncbi:uncharacterized protein E6C27_scaffold697G00040 [Cucumis melo var. makuwa]|uniref:Reverse transcriptase n=1 Tax=Cucumis melo var. makuwa TaxID=1194695 RepID=A0A5A7UNE4_CUCMM|nr:uncharacterized protein E6C27_scaffold697G00040 [Cucumis melo var. makuwa]